MQGRANKNLVLYFWFLFSAMDALDGDGQALASKGRMALRDIVQVGICQDS